MRRFNYVAKDPKTGKIVKGAIQAETEHEAGRLLVDQGFVPESVQDESNNSNIIDKLTNRITSKDKVTFSRQFATLIGAGLPLANSLKTVAEQTQNREMRTIVEEILASVESGKSLSESFEKYPRVFDNVFIALIRAGESSGTLDEALNRIANQQEKDAAMLSKIRGAMVYPAIILVVIIAVLAFMMIMVVPEVRGLYEDMHKELPGLTKFLVWLTDFFANFWWLVLAVLVIIVWGIIQYKRTEGGRRFFDNMKLHIPLFKDLFLRLYMSRFARTTEMLLAVGVSMLDSIHIGMKAVNNVIIEEQLEKAAEEVKGGKSLSEALEGKPYVLSLVPQMANIGEQSGKIDEMLGRAATVYETELDERIAAISTMIEPILMVVMAAIIGVVLGGTLLPIYSLVNSI